MTSCVPCVEGYKQFKIDKGIARFSFEYPCNWKVYISNDDVYESDISIWAPKLKIDNNYIASTKVFIYIYYPNGSISNAQEELVYWLKFWQEHFDQFEVIERSSVELDGVPGEQSTNRYIYYTDYPTTDPNFARYPRIEKAIYLDYKGLIWSIQIYTYEEIAKEHSVYIDHFLDSFQFLD